MNTPAVPESGSVVKRGRRPLVFQTGGGKLAAPQPGERVNLDDARRLVDLVLVFDTTGSMWNKLKSLVQCLVEFISTMAGLRLDWRFSLVPFGDLRVPGDRVVGNLPFVETADAATQMIHHAPHFNGGGNRGESSLEALAAAIGKPWRPGAIKVIILVTDERPHTDRLTPGVINTRLHEGEFICFVASPKRCGLEALATENGGKWYPIGPNLDTRDLLRFIQSLLRDVGHVSDAVFALGGGSVRRYLDSSERRALEE
jgi:hypothetical protein